jgi:cation:H+ antiporter
MTLPSAFLQFMLAATVVVFAGNALTRCADAIAELTKLGRLLVGSIFLAAATSLPELTVDISAVRMGLPDLAVGDLLGSSLFNLLILAVADLMNSSRGRMLSRESAAHALSAAMSIALTALAGISIFVGARLGAWTFGGIGIGSLAILGAYLLGVRMVYFDQRVAAAKLPDEAGLAAPGMTLRKAVTGFVIAAGVIVVAAPFVAEAAGRIAELSGLGSTFVGTTLVAFSTSLPELVATIAAVRMKAFDLALGNIFGSNSFNMILLVPLDLAHPGALLAAVSQAHILTALAVIMATAVAVLGQLYKVERRIRFIEPDAALVIAIILGSLALIYFMG